MIFPSGLKRICDISFYMTFASVVGGWFGSDDMTLTLPIFAWVAFLSAWLAPRGRIKYISVIPLIFIFVITPLTMINAVVLFPLILFVIASLPTPDEHVTSFEYSGVFKLFLMLFLGLGAVTVFLNQSATTIIQIPNDTTVFSISFLFNSIIFMRMIRHDESVLKQARFKIMNTISIVGVVMSAILMSTDVFLTFGRNVISLIWWQIIAPIFAFVIGLGVTSFTFILGIFGLENIFEHEPYEAPEIGIQMMEEGGELTLFQSVFIFFISIFVTALLIALVILLLVLVRKLFKRLTEPLRLPYLGIDGVEEERFFLDDDGKKKRRVSHRTENQIREVYRKFLILLKKQEVNIPLHFTSSDVNDLVTAKFESKTSSQLRDEYIQVRYGASKYSKEDVKRIKYIYKETKKEIERF